VGVRVNRAKITERWGQIQGKWDLVRISGGSYPSASYRGSTVHLFTLHVSRDVMCDECLSLNCKADRTAKKGNNFIAQYFVRRILQHHRGTITER